MRNRRKVISEIALALAMALSLTVLYSAAAPSPSLAGECQNWQTLHPEWIFCDDFESASPLVGSGRYFDYSDGNGSFVLASGVGMSGSQGMQATWQPGQVDAGYLRLAFGRNPDPSMDKGIKSNQDFKEVYYRMYMKMQPGWQGSPIKVSRATVFTDSNYSQAMIAHLWGDDAIDYTHIFMDPVSCVSGGSVVCSGYNDFAHMKWLGETPGVYPIFDPSNAGRWFCIESHVKLNDPGQSNGIQEYWIDGKLQASKTNLNFVGSYTAYAINGIFFENYWNSGSPRTQSRYMDNIVISTKPVGCAQTMATPNPPLNLQVQ